MKKLVTTIAAVVLAAATPTVAHAQTRGVSQTEILVGTVAPLQGMHALLGDGAVKGLRLRFEQANAKGGIHGRQIRLLVRDSQSLPKIAGAMTRALLVDQKVFAVIGSLYARWPARRLVLRAQALDLFPYNFDYEREPYHPLSFGLTKRDFPSMRPNSEDYLGDAKAVGPRGTAIIEAFDAKYHEPMSKIAAAAYVGADLFVEAARRAGPELTVKGLAKAMETIKGYINPFGGPPISFGPRRHWSR